MKIKTKLQPPGWLETVHSLQ